MLITFRSGSIIVAYDLLYAVADAANLLSNITSFLSGDAVSILANASIAGSNVDQTYLNTVVTIELVAAGMSSEHL